MKKLFNGKNAARSNLGNTERTKAMNTVKKIGAVLLLTAAAASAALFSACGASAPNAPTTAAYRSDEAATYPAASAYSETATAAATTAAATTYAEPANEANASDYGYGESAPDAQADRNAELARDNSAPAKNNVDGPRYNYDRAQSIQPLPSDKIAPIPLKDEEYLKIDENYVKDVNSNPFLTFSLKVDSASYTNVARYINSGNLPPADAVRVEEMINYFNYNEPVRENETPFGIYTEVGPSPFNESMDLAFVRVKSKEIDKSQLPDNNLTFLIDTSGSMDSYDKLPLLKLSFGLLIDKLTANDVISVVTYAGNSSVLLDSVRGDQKDKISKAINGLKAGGSTAGGAGINQAYALAEKNFNPRANNRVILATDGDFNVGVSSISELERLIANKRASGVYLTILGFGTENLKDDSMETLAKNGNGNYSYIDSASTAQKVLIDEMGANLYTIADDVKAQIEFNPALVEAYRLIGYENRLLADKDFADDTKDAGEIGVGTDVVLLFEIKRVAENGGVQSRYGQTSTGAVSAAAQQDDEYANELFAVNIRYKDPGKSVSKLIVEPVTIDRFTQDNTGDFVFAASVAGFGHLLRNSPYSGNVSIQAVRSAANANLGADRGGYRKEFVELVDKYIQLRR